MNHFPEVSLDSSVNRDHGYVDPDNPYTEPGAPRLHVALVVFEDGTTLYSNTSISSVRVYPSLSLGPIHDSPPASQPLLVVDRYMRREATPRAKTIGIRDDKRRKAEKQMTSQSQCQQVGNHHHHQRDDDDDDDEEEEEGEEVTEHGGGGEDVQLQGDSTRADLKTLTAVSTPIPRGAMHLNKIRSPDYFRTQYLSNLGIWATKQAGHLNSAPRTEARYKSNLG